MEVFGTWDLVLVLERGARVDPLGGRLGGDGPALIELQFTIVGRHQLNS